MKHTLVVFHLLIAALSFAQFSFMQKTEPTGDPDIHYYTFHHGLQMIEFDYLSAYHRRVNYLEQAQPRALTWEMVLGPPQPNVYLFRTEQGEIIKRYGDVDESKLLNVEESLKIAKTHQSFSSQLGSSIGFSEISTRYFPYYLIGSQSSMSPNQLGLIDSLGNTVLEPKYSAIYPFDNLFISIIGSTYELRDRYLNMNYSSREFQLQPALYHFGHTYIMKDEKVGLIDAAGKQVIPCEYDMLIDQFDENGLAQVHKNGMIGYVNIYGEEVIQCKYQSAGYFKEGLLDVRLHDKWGYIDVKGKTVIPHQYEIGICFEEGLARVAKRESGQYFFGFIDKQGNEVIPLIYSDARDFKDGIAEVMVDGKWIKINREGIKQ